MTSPENQTCCLTIENGKIFFKNITSLIFVETVVTPTNNFPYIFLIELGRIFSIGRSKKQTLCLNFISLVH